MTPKSEPPQTGIAMARGNPILANAFTLSSRPPKVQKAWDKRSKKYALYSHTIQLIIDDGVGWVKTYQNLSQWPRSNVMVKRAAANVTRLASIDIFLKRLNNVKLKTEAMDENMYAPLESPTK